MYLWPARLFLWILFMLEFLAKLYGMIFWDIFKPKWPCFESLQTYVVEKSRTDFINKKNVFPFQNFPVCSWKGL